VRTANASAGVVDVSLRPEIDFSGREIVDPGVESFGVALHVDDVGVANFQLNIDIECCGRLCAARHSQVRRSASEG
jgi:hypothetical protein